ncbi:MAG TPA: 6-phosphogluconolactonase [Anaerohalosphaeraceae bacterium]|nr:6-phosphogluconolactonase [Phycisphaerae bacterium]HOK95052.1 6-phosphogluconolactonase [Anaerohalosphaeraceae bacterium]HOL32411.1 6-phosphogluconolactonase [Anaerohalosphaeraceae bacterium]HOM76531.1 6-phosphogluconolactonase [Anaerohalosphaeraceae bacterium]HPC63902.1 6-phosphogluconolactonase [Anaerohalosphaeraceae bacterium]
MRYLAIDHGQKRTGLAVCDASETVITPHSVIDVSADSRLIEQISKVLKDEKIEAIVIGLPVNMDSTEGPRASAVRQFARRLAEQTACPIYFQDERLSSFEAKSLATEFDWTRQQKKKRLDALAAADILRSFLSSPKACLAKLHLIKAANLEMLSELALDFFCKAASEAIRQGRNFYAALSGGQTPLRFFDKLPDAALCWKRIHLFWVDERCVDPDNPASNFGQARRAFLQKIDIPSENIHRIRGEHQDSTAAAAEYEENIRSAFHLAPDQWPQFDLIVLGVGSDGHIGSVFPDAYHLLETNALASVVQRDDYRRITLTMPVIQNARRILVLAAGRSKADILRCIFTSEAQPLRYPIHGLWPVLHKVTWIMDEAAASLLEAARA